MRINQKMILATALLAAVLLVPGMVTAHCQIPCGIYDDNARVMAMLEDVATIRKSIKLINDLAAKEDAQSKQQFVRWVTNKEAHAQKIIETISDYFMTQRVKPDQKDYVERLKKHHAVVLAAMAAKQKADPQVAVELEKNVKALLAYYPEHKE